MSHPMKYPLLVIDAGNTSVKFAKVARAGGAPKLVTSVPTAKLTIARAKHAGSGCRAVYISSVVPSASRVLKRAYPAAQFIGARTKTGFATVVDRKTIGSDRLANVAVAHARHGGKTIVASFGTAATFDLIDSKGFHRGGAIAPGWKSFAGILSAHTALLPRLGAKKARCFAGRDTREALTAGIGGGYALMVSGIIAMLADEAGVKNPRVVFTGGDADAVAALLPWKAVTDPLLTLRGIALLAQGIAREASK